MLPSEIFPLRFAGIPKQSVSPLAVKHPPWIGVGVDVGVLVGTGVLVGVGGTGVCIGVFVAVV